MTEERVEIHKRILQGPKYKVFEHVAAEFAAVYYEAGRSTGLTSKFKDARSFARANFEKFIPKAIEHCVTLLGRQDIPDLCKAEIYEAIMERNNDPDINAMTGNTLPDIQVKKLLDMLPKQDKIKREVRTVLHNQNNPYLKVN